MMWEGILIGGALVLAFALGHLAGAEAQIERAREACRRVSGDPIGQLVRERDEAIAERIYFRGNEE